MRALLALALLGCGASRHLDAPAPPPTRKIEQLNRPQVRFANAHNGWRKFVLNLSPASPDFWEQVKAEWERRQVSEKFRALEEVVRLAPLDPLPESERVTH